MAAEDVALALLPGALDPHESVHHVAHVDVAEATGGREPQRAAQVLLGDERRDAVDVARADHEGRAGDDDVLAVAGRGERDLLAAPFGRGVRVRAGALGERRVLVERLVGSLGHAHRGDARDVHHPLHPRRPRSGEHVLDAADVDGLHVRALGLEVRDDAREVEDGGDALDGAHEARAVGDIAVHGLAARPVHRARPALQDADLPALFEQSRHQDATDEPGRAPVTRTRPSATARNISDCPNVAISCMNYWDYAGTFTFEPRSL